MKELEKLLDRIIQRVNINLREIEYDVNPLVRNLIPPNQMTKFYAFYGITPHHPLNFQFRHSNLSGSYFLGKCSVTNSLLYKSDIRGDELKQKEDLFQYQEFEIPMAEDEEIEINLDFSMDKGLAGQKAGSQFFPRSRNAGEIFYQGYHLHPLRQYSWFSIRWMFSGALFNR